MSEYIAREVTLNNPSYPPLLHEIPDPPSRIFVRGELPPKSVKTVAVVGTRKATSAGTKLAKEISARLAAEGIVIVSGLAMGIDAAAHEGTLKSKGKTIAVLGNGIDYIYPRSNEKLGFEILKSGGAIISEYPAGSPSYPGNFLARNRIVSGLSDATVVIEAPEQSGSLVTARLAAEQGREVFVIPGPISHPNYRGSHALIRDGARLVSSVEDILLDLGIESHNRAEQTLQKELNLEESLIVSALLNAGTGLNIDKLVELTKLEPQVINQTIALLVINGLVKETEKGYTL